MRKMLFGLLLIGSIQTTLAQQSTVRGKVSDTLEKKSLQNAAVSLLQKSDSTLFKFARTDKQGTFHIDGVVPGKYILLITYPKFADFADVVEIKNQPENNLGEIPLTLKSRLLDQLLCEAPGPYVLKATQPNLLRIVSSLRKVPR